MSDQEGQLPTDAELMKQLTALLADVHARIRDGLENMPRNGTPSRSTAWSTHRKLSDLAEKLTSALEDFA